MAPIHRLDPYKVQEIKVLAKENDAKARELLEAVAKQVQPLLRRHKLQVPLLSEFYPHNPNLLGLNIGGGGGDTQEIRIRLRRAGRPLDFYDLNHTLGTMLHEITHNTHGRHDEAFYKQLDKYIEECEELMANGIKGTGAGFDAPAAGKVGGQFAERDLGLPARRELALRAAQKRAKKQALMPSGPNKLGGDLTLRLACDPREAAAIAAEQRTRDNVWCPNERLREEAEAGHIMDSALQKVLEGPGAGVGQERGTKDAAPASAQPGSQRKPAHQQAQQQQMDASQRAGDLTSLRQGKAAAAPHQAQQKGRGRQQRGVGGGEPDGEPIPCALPSVSAALPALGTNFIDLTGDDDCTLPAAGGQLAGVAAAAAGAGTAQRLPPLKRPKPTGGLAPTITTNSLGAFGTGWACARCTLVNSALALQCDACGGLQPAGFTGP